VVSRAVAWSLSPGANLFTLLSSLLETVSQAQADVRVPAVLPEELENEPDLVAPDARQVIVRGVCQVLSVDHDLA